MATNALHVQLVTSGVVNVGENVLFDQTVFTDGSINYDSSTGTVFCNDLGKYVFFWWVATQASISANGTVFSLSSTVGGDLGTGDSPIKTGQASGHAVIENGGFQVSLTNTSTAPFYFSQVVPVQASLLVVRNDVTPGILRQVMGYAFEIPTAGVNDTVAPGGLLPLSQDGFFFDVSRVNATTLFVSNPGAPGFLVDFTVNAVSAPGAAVAVVLDGAVQPSTNRVVLDTLTEVSGSFIVNPFVTIALMNNSDTPLVLGTNPDVSVQLRVYGLSPDIFP